MISHRAMYQKQPVTKYKILSSSSLSTVACQVTERIEAHLSRICKPTRYFTYTLTLELEQLQTFIFL
jgi:hypothetical protein